MASLELGDSRLPEHLKRMKMTQAEFARALEVDRQFIQQILKKERRFSFIHPPLSLTLHLARKPTQSTLLISVIVSARSGFLP
ncbi:helix-turn-helix domain-containing protein [Paenibacillus sp. Leaf72]|uniref:helix-turn-helix domain-containing protein n=1 Tax=Paenibacillus sp. Leaf72 TaxID=1736234 RepID=UPI0006FC5CC2|nr:helix-turn-helix transcriptional regulator [Paenibacillus sp. Leaf72]KQO00729.1 hypothetical protein ASF12_18440 [Paenibacillus sp. Leaf72]